MYHMPTTILKIGSMINDIEEYDGTKDLSGFFRHDVYLDFNALNFDRLIVIKFKVSVPEVTQRC